MEHEVIIGVDPAVPGMSGAVDILEGTPVLPRLETLRQKLQLLRSPEEPPCRVGIALATNCPELGLAVRMLGVERLALFHSTQVKIGASLRPRLRALFAAVDLCIVPDEASELEAVELGADPDRISRLSARSTRRLFDEPPRATPKRAVLEMAASLALDAADSLGLVRALERLTPDRGVNIVNYHRVLPLTELTTYTRPQMAIAEPVFAAQLAEMAETRGFAPLDRIHDVETTGRISVTFDDGYEDNLRVALPILERFSAPACIFLVSNLIGRPDALWWDRVGMALFAWWKAGAAGPLPRVLPERLEELGRVTAFEHARAIISSALSDLNLVPESDRNEAVAAAEGLIAAEDAAGRTMLSWEEVEALARAGVNFGAHTRNHVPLDELSRDEAVEELLGSQQDIEARVGKQPYQTCALPRGRLGDLTEEDLRQTFTSVMTTDAGVHGPNDPDLFVKRRDGRMLTLAGRHHPAKLRLELSGWVDRLRAAYHNRARQRVS